MSCIALTSRSEIVRAILAMTNLLLLAILLVLVIALLPAVAQFVAFGAMIVGIGFVMLFAALLLANSDISFSGIFAGLGQLVVIVVITIICIFFVVSLVQHFLKLASWIRMVRLLSTFVWGVIMIPYGLWLLDWLLSGGDESSFRSNLMSDTSFDPMFAIYCTIPMVAVWLMSHYFLKSIEVSESIEPYEQKESK